MSKKNPLVFLDMSIDGDPAERMVFELFSNAAPRTAENFRALCTGEKGISSKTGRPLHYKGSFFHRIVKGLLAQGGDIISRDGTCGESIYGEKFPDEPISKLKHDERGMLTIALADREMRGSLFSLTFKPNHQLDRKHVVFGKLVKGYEVLEKIDNVGDEDGFPSVTVKIVNCGEFFDEKKKREKLKRGKDGSSELLEVNREGKRKKSSRKRRRKYYSSESETSLDSETESSDSDSDSESSSLSSSSDDKRKKRKRSSKRDGYKHQKKKNKKHEKKRRKRARKSKRRSKRASDTNSQSESSDDGDADADRIKQTHKTSEMIAQNHPSLAGGAVSQEKGATDIFEKEVEYPRENGDFQSNGVDLEAKAGTTVDRPDVVDDHPGKSRSRSLSPKRSLSKSMSISHEKSLSPRQSIRRPRFDKSPKLTYQRSRSISRSPVTGKKGRSISRSPARDVKRNLSRSPVKFSLVSRRKSSIKAPSRRSISKSPTRARARSSFSRSPASDRGKSLSKSPARDVKRSLSRSLMRDVNRSLSRSPMRDVKRSLSRSPISDVKRSLSRSPGMVPSRRGKSRSPIRAHARRSYSRSPVSDRGRSLSKSPRDESPKRIRRGRGFSQRYSYARRYRTPSPDRSPVRSYRYGRNDRERYRWSPPRYNRSPRDRTPLRNSPRRYRSPPAERSPVRRSPRRYRSPPRERSPLRYRSRKNRTRSPLSQSPTRYRAESRTPHSRSRSPLITRPSPEPPSPKGANSHRSRSSSSRSPVGNNNKSLVSYDDGSPDFNEG